MIELIRMAANIPPTRYKPGTPEQRTCPIQRRCVDAIPRNAERTTRDIAEALGMTVDAVRANLHRAEKRGLVQSRKAFVASPYRQHRRLATTSATIFWSRQ